jgi:hypothetical protein
MGCEYVARQRGVGKILAIGVEVGVG